MQTAQHDAWIRERAYAIWEDEGRPAGREYQHWFQAASEAASRITIPLIETAAGKGASTPVAKSQSAKGRTTKSRKSAA